MTSPSQRPPPAPGKAGHPVPGLILQTGRFLADTILIVGFLYAAGYVTLGRLLPLRAAALMTAMLAAGPLLAFVLLGFFRIPAKKVLLVLAGSAASVGMYFVVGPTGAGAVRPTSFATFTACLIPLRWLLLSADRWGPPTGRWLAESERSGRWSLVRPANDFLLAIVTARVVGGYALNRDFTLTDLLGLGACAAAGQALACSYADRIRPHHGLLRAGKVVLGAALAFCTWAVAGAAHELAPSSQEVALIYSLLLPLQLAWHAWHRRLMPRRGGAMLAPLQWTIVIYCVLLLHQPLLGNGTTGAGDAYWYRLMIADFVTQWRAGAFPVFAGQTEFAFNGAVSPFRVAPALQHFAGLIDLLTLHRMGFPGLLNLVLVLCYLGGALTCHGCLRAIEPRAPWLAVGLSLLFAMCPGILGLAYAGDLFMSVSTLPFVPLVLYGAWRTLARRDLMGMVIMTSALAALWYCHPPIAFWATVIATLTQLVRLAPEIRDPKTWKTWGIGAACFGLLSLACFVSVATLGLPGNPANREVILRNLGEAFGPSLKPVSANMASLGNYQLGWSLWLGIAAGLVGLVLLRPRRPLAGLMAAVLVLLAFALPVPWLNHKLWMTVPQVVCDMTYMWPMQRFYVLLGALSAFAAYLPLSAALVRWPRFALGLMPVLVAGVAWSFTEGIKFPRRNAESMAKPEAAKLQLLLQNAPLTRYSFNPFPQFPNYFSHGVMDPLMEFRLLYTDARREFDSNRAALAREPGAVVARGVFTTTRTNPESPVLELVPRLTLHPGRRYALTFDFVHPEYAGSFMLNGNRLNRMYWLPDSGFGTTQPGESRAFGTGTSQSRTITLWTDGTAPEEIRLQFVFSGSIPREVDAFARFELTTFDPARLPIRVETWAPLRAHVHSDGDTWLETPRLYLSGYKATVNQQVVRVSRSPEGLVKIPVPAGESIVELAYSGPVTLRLAYFASLAGWLVLLGLASRAAWRRDPPAA